MVRVFETDGPGAPLGLTGLGGQLFSAAELGPLQSAELDNGTLLSALAKLSLFRQPDTGQLSRVNYGALATEEFGSLRLKNESMILHSIRMLKARTLHSLTFRKVFWP